MKTEPDNLIACMKSDWWIEACSSCICSDTLFSKSNPSFWKEMEEVMIVLNEVLDEG
jgi:hypothetical protein